MVLAGMSTGGDPMHTLTVQLAEHFHNTAVFVQEVTIGNDCNHELITFTYIRFICNSARHKAFNNSAINSIGMHTRCKCSDPTTMELNWNILLVHLHITRQISLYLSIIV